MADRTRVPSNASSSDAQSEKQTHSLRTHHARALSTKDVDIGAQLVAGLSFELDPTEAARVRRKIDYHILPMMCALYCIQYMDKATLGNAAILGINQGAHLSTNQYNWLGTIFYISYIVFEYPQNLALQKFPIGRWLSINIFVWAIALICQAACTNFAGLFVCRLFLGMCEGSIVAGFMIVTSVFYTRKEQMLRVGYWFSMSGIAQLVSGFISFGCLHIKTPGFAPWKWLMVITGIITFIIAAIYWFFFPDSPANSWFLSPSERVTAVQRLKENQTGVGNRHFKVVQMIEALLDPKTWLFALFAFSCNIPSSLVYQRQIIVSSFGFNYLDTTLLSCVDGFLWLLTIPAAVILAVRIPNGRAYVAALFYIPPIVGVLLIQLLPWSKQVGLLFGIWLADIGITPFPVALSWMNNVTAGHTKRITTNAIMLIALCIGNSVGPFMWQSKYKPRNRVPWIVIGTCFVLCSLCLLTIRWILVRENTRRDNEHVKDDEDYFIEMETGDGRTMRVKVDKEFMDLTDRQNRDFRYVL